MKRLKKTLAVALSLVLCGSLVAPSFAAVELNKDQHIDTETGALKANSEGNYDYYLGGDVTLDKTLVIGAGIAASIELNGHTLQLNESHESTLTSDGYLDKLKIEDSSVIDDETITWRDYKVGSVINVEGTGAELVVTDSSALDEDGNYVVGKGSGAISGGHSGNGYSLGGGGGGVRVNDGGSFTMKGGSISENRTMTYHGGGIMVENGTVELDNVTVSGNTAQRQGAGIFAKDSTVVLTGVNVSQNTVNKSGYGGGIYAENSTVTLTDSTVSHNKNNIASTNGIGGGIYAVNGSKITLNDSEVSYNHTYGTGSGIYAAGSGTTVEINGGAVGKNKADSSYNTVGDIDARNGATATMNGATICSNNGSNAGADTTHDGGGWDEGVVTKAPTCAEAGEMTYTCKFCKKETKTETIDKLEHTPGETVRENVVEATCAAEGSYDAVVYCSECDEKLSSTEETIDKLEHTPGEVVRENEVPAQIGVAGSYDEVVKCSECGEELSREAKEIPALQPDTPDEPVITPDVPVDPTVEIDEPDVPLAGMPIELEPEDKLTRAQLIAILHWMDGEPAAELATFLDVLAGSDYAEAIGWAQENGIAFGVGGNRFAPEEYVTRGQLIDFLNRYAAYVGSDLVLELDGDADEVLTWAQAEEIINDFFDRL